MAITSASLPAKKRILTVCVRLFLEKGYKRSTLAEIIEKEDKKNPYPDEVLAEMLKEKGFPVARRTVAKYRMQLGLPVARLRK